MAIGFYAGSFDPVTNGHIEILDSALGFCDKLIIAIGRHPQKDCFFTVKERIKLWTDFIIQERPESLSFVEITAFEGLAVDSAQTYGADFMIRGVRDNTDFDYEMRLADINRLLKKGLQTIFIPATVERRALSSSAVRQIHQLGGDVSMFVPKNVMQSLVKKTSNGRIK